MEESAGSPGKRITRRTPSAPSLADIELCPLPPVTTGPLTTTTTTCITTTTTTAATGTLPTAIVSPSTSQLPMAGYNSPHSVLRNPFARVIAGTTTTSTESLS